MKDKDAKLLEEKYIQIKEGINNTYDYDIYDDSDDYEEDLGMVSLNIDNIDWIQQIYAKFGEDAAMEAFEDNAKTVAKKVGLQITDNIEFEGERGGIFAIFNVTADRIPNQRYLNTIFSTKVI